MPRSLNSDFPARLVVTLAIRGYLVVNEEDFIYNYNNNRV